MCLFRIETLASYDTAATASGYRRWLVGETEPHWELRRPWLDKLTEWGRAQGRPRRRVRVIHDPIAQYERYTCKWSYPSSVVAGELVHVLDLGEIQPPKELHDAPGAEAGREQDVSDLALVVIEPVTFPGEIPLRWPWHVLTTPGPTPNLGDAPGIGDLIRELSYQRLVERSVARDHHPAHESTQRTAARRAGC